MENSISEILDLSIPQDWSSTQGVRFSSKKDLLSILVRLSTITLIRYSTTKNQLLQSLTITTSWGRASNTMLIQMTTHNWELDQLGSLLKRLSITSRTKSMLFLTQAKGKLSTQLEDQWREMSKLSWRLSQLTIVLWSTLQIKDGYWPRRAKTSLPPTEPIFSWRAYSKWEITCHLISSHFTMVWFYLLLITNLELKLKERPVRMSKSRPMPKPNSLPREIMNSI